jgi:hypothetical protein
LAQERERERGGREFQIRGVELPNILDNKFNSNPSSKLKQGRPACIIPYSLKFVRKVNSHGISAVLAGLLFVAWSLKDFACHTEIMLWQNLLK